MPARTNSSAARRHTGGGGVRRARHNTRDERRARDEGKPRRTTSQDAASTPSSASATPSSDADTSSDGDGSTNSPNSSASSASEYDVEAATTDDDDASVRDTDARRGSGGVSSTSKPQSPTLKTSRAGANSSTVASRQHRSAKPRSGGGRDGRPRSGRRSTSALMRKRGRPPRGLSPRESSAGRSSESLGGVVDAPSMTPHVVHECSAVGQCEGGGTATAVRRQGSGDGPRGSSTMAAATVQTTASTFAEPTVVLAGHARLRRRIESLEQCLWPTRTTTMLPTASWSGVMHRFVPGDGSDDMSDSEGSVGTRATAEEAASPMSSLTRVIDEAVARTRATSLSPLPAALNAAVMESRALQQQGRSPSFLLSHPHAYLATPHFSLYAGATSLVLPRRPDPSHTAAHPPSNVRECGVVVPVVVGSCVRLINPDKREKSHQWTVYVRGLHNGHPRCTDDTSPDGDAALVGGRLARVPEAETDYLSHFVEKVVFVLDRSFTPYVRTVTQAPFELTEVGWGEFVVMMYVYLKYDGRQASSRARRVQHRLQHYVYEGNATGNNTGGNSNGSSTLNADGSNVYVDTMLEINHNDAARALFYRGPLLPPYLVAYSSEEDSTSVEGDGGSESTTFGSARSQQGDDDDDDDAEADPPVHIAGKARRHTRAATEQDHDEAGDDSGRAAFVKSERRHRGVKVEPGMAESAEDVLTRPRDAGSRHATSTAVPVGEGSGEAVGSVVTLSHLLRFSHRTKLPLGIPPVGDVRMQDRTAELAGYVHVSEPVVTERYDELVLPLPCLPATSEDDDDDEDDLNGAEYSCPERRPKVEVKHEGRRGGGLVKREGEEMEVKAARVHPGTPRTARDRATRLLAAARRMESQLRDCLRHYCLDGARTAAARDCLAYTTTTAMRGGVSCWPTIISHGDAMERDMLCTAAYLRSTAASAQAEGWLAAVLGAGRTTLTSDASWAHRRNGEDWPCVPPLTPPEYDVMGALLALPELDGRAAFTRLLVPHAVEFGAVVLSALQARTTIATPSFALYNELHERGTAMAVPSKSTRGATHHSHALQGNFVNGDKKRLFGHVADLEMLTQLRTGLQENIHAMRVEATRRQAAQTLREL